MPKFNYHPYADFTTHELQRLSQLPIVPTQSDADKNSPLRWLPPTQCYFAGETKDSFRSKLFVFVNFGSPANGFLSACGTKHEPSVEEVALMLLADPHKFYTFSGGPTQ